MEKIKFTPPGIFVGQTVKIEFPILSYPPGAMVNLDVGGHLFDFPASPAFSISGGTEFLSAGDYVVTAYLKAPSIVIPTTIPAPLRLIMNRYKDALGKANPTKTPIASGILSIFDTLPPYPPERLDCKVVTATDIISLLGKHNIFAKPDFNKCTCGTGYRGMQYGDWLYFAPPAKVITDIFFPRWTAWLFDNRTPGSTLVGEWMGINYTGRQDCDDFSLRLMAAMRAWFPGIPVMQVYGAPSYTGYYPHAFNLVAALNTKNELALYHADMTSFMGPGGLAELEGTQHALNVYWIHLN